MLISAQNITKKFSDNVVFENVSLTIEDGCRYGLIGVNGAGKSTLLTVLLGESESDSGEVYRKVDLNVGVLKQNSGLDRDSTIICEMQQAFDDVLAAEDRMREIEDEMSRLTENDSAEYKRLAAAYSAKQAYIDSRDGYNTDVKIKTVLTGMGFADKPYDTPIKLLSGGERARLALCIIMLEKSNVLLLDEPTNHLDLNLKEVLEAALNDFGGTVIFISHDRYLLNKVPDKIVEITRDGAVVYDGNYEYYKERSQQQAKAAEPPKETKKKTDGGYRSREMRRADAMRKQQIKQIEDEISYLEQTCKTLEEELSCEEVYSSFELTREKSLELESANKRLEECFEEWEKLSEE